MEELENFHISRFDHRTLKQKKLYKYKCVCTTYYDFLKHAEGDDSGLICIKFCNMIDSIEE